MTDPIPPDVPQTTTADGGAGAVRRFDRYCVSRIRHLDRLLAGTALRGPEWGVLTELEARQAATATDLCRSLLLDPGYLSRLLAGVERRGLVARRRCTSDARRRVVSLTPEGAAQLRVVARRVRQDDASRLHRLSAHERDRLFLAMRTIEEFLGAGGSRTSARGWEVRDGAP